MPVSKYAGESSVFKIHRFQNLPAKNVPFSCEREAYPSYFSPGGGGYLTKEVTGVSGKSLHTLYSVA